MMGKLQRALCLRQVTGKGSTLLRGCSTSAPELSISIALTPLLKSVGTSEELNIHPSHEV